MNEIEILKEKTKNRLIPDLRECLTKLESLSQELKYKLGTIFFLSYPEGIHCPPRYFQPIDHNSLKGIGIFMDIDGCISFLDKEGNIVRSCYLEAKTSNEINQFDHWISNKDTKRRRIQLEHLIDCNTRTQDLVIYATHDIPEHECITLDNLIIKKIYIKRDDLNDEKGQWIDDCNGYSVLDLAISLCKNETGL